MKKFNWRGSFINNHVFAYFLGCDNMDYLLENSCTRNSSIIKKSFGKPLIIQGNWQYTITTHNDWTLNHKFGEFTNTRNYKKHTSKNKKRK